MPLPTAKTQSQALAFVRSVSNEQSLPVDATVIGFINDGLEWVTTELNPLYNVESITVAPGSVLVTLPTDIQQIYKVTWSTLLPTAPGTIEYPVQVLGPEGFVDQTGSAPTVLGGPVILCRLVQDENNALQFQVFPVAPAGFFNVYYSVRVTQYDPGSQGSTTNLDSAYVNTALYYAIARTCEARENLKKAAFFDAKALKMLEANRITLKNRRKRRGAVTRDVTQGPQVVPAWYPR